jgi:hypothetical protein
MRDPKKQEELGDISGVKLMALMSLTAAKSRLRLSKLWHQAVWTWVFNNAGYGLAGPLEGFSDEQILDAHPMIVSSFDRSQTRKKNEGRQRRQQERR